MSTKESYPVRVEQYHGVSVTIHEVEGKDYLASEDIGRCLGLSDPRKSVNKIYNRNRDELEPHQVVVKLATTGGVKDHSLFSETGANLIGMFSRTAKAKDFRLWLARLPRKQRQVQEALPEALEQAFQQGRKRGVTMALRLLDCPAVAKLGLEGVSELVWARQRGDTQQEAGERLGISKDTAQEVEKALKELGIYFPAVSGLRRKREMRLALAYALGAEEERPALPAPEQDS